jgi:hypothetical protein
MKDELKMIWLEARDDKMERIWKEEFVPLSKFVHSIFPEEADFGEP